MHCGRTMAAAVAGLLAASALAAGEFDDLKFRSIGPAVAGRATRVAGVPGDPTTFYIAFAQSGVWKSTDGGHAWKPVFDDQGIQSVGSIAVAASDPNVVYVGTGEANIRGNVQPGDGIYKSTDAGLTWTQVWRQRGQIGTLLVHPTDPDVAYAAVLGSAFGPNPERGIYRTRDGGKSWQQVLAKDAETGASDVAMDPGNPRLLFAGLWQARRHPWGMTSGGPGSGLYRSRDGGDSWKQLSGKGLPPGPWGKVGVAVARSTGPRVYALIEAEAGGLFRSDDGGESWQQVNDHHALTQRAWYYSTITVDPANPDLVWFPQVPLLRSKDGGKSIHSVEGPHHGDYHDLWIDPVDSRRMIVGHDGGADLTVDGGKSWYRPALATGQFYNLDVDDRIPYWVGGTMQDEGTALGPSNSLRSEGITLGDWITAGGGEAGDFAFDRATPGVVYAGEYGGIFTRFDQASGNAPNVSYYPTNPSGHGAEDLRVRFQWTAPILTSRHHPGVVYHAANLLYRSADGGRSWKAVSPDLTRDDKTKQRWSGGPITGDNTGVEIYDTIFSLAESPHDPAELWAGTDDGLLHRTRDGGATWQNVTPPGMPEWATVESIALSSHEPLTAWIAVDAHRLDDDRPYLFRTRDGGVTWQSAVAGIAEEAYVLAVREDPTVAGLLFAGTRVGVYLSRDGGDRWEPLKAGLPPVVVVDLEVHQGDLVIATAGRSLWILDDLTAIRQWSAEITDRPLHLFAPRPSRRWTYGGGWSSEGAAENPPRGATIHYYLKAAAQGEVRLEIRDAGGRLVRELSSVATPQYYPEDDPDEPMKKPQPALSREAGLHRAVWDLRWKGAERLSDAKVDLGEPQNGPRAIPGEYLLRLTVDGATAESTLTVLPDPRSTVAAEDLAEQLAFALELRAELDRVVADIDQARAIRRQAADLVDRLATDPRAGELLDAARRAVATADDLLDELFNPRAEVVYDILAQEGGTQLHSNLAFLFETAKWDDGAPTQGMREVHAELQARLAALEERLAALRSGELAELESLARALDLPRILLRQPIEAEELH